VTAALDAVLGAWPSIELAAVDAAVDLQTRHDTKYLLTEEALITALTSFGPGWQVLEVNGTQAVHYRTVYFDDPEFGCLRDHRQGRRRRVKIRTRRYGTAPDSMLEAKLRTGRGATEKLRWPRPAGPLDMIASAEIKTLQAVIGAEPYRVVVAEELRPMIEILHQRRTLIRLSTNERVTIDVEMTALRTGTTQVVDLLAGAAVLELKSREPLSPLARDLLAAGLRPVPFSKYRIAAARLIPGAEQGPARDAERALSLMWASG
jgi:hypothetical protein